MMFGVATFSFIMSQFIEILLNYKSLWMEGHPKDLSKWIALLSRFNNGNPLTKDLITKIEDFFDYYWAKNRLAALNTEHGERFMEELPDTVKSQIYIDYLFADYLKNYRRYFNPHHELATGGIFKSQLGSVFNEENQDSSVRHFLVQFCHRLEPRYYKPNGDLIQDQWDEIFEVVYVMKGSVGVGYRLFNETFFGVRLMMTNEKKISAGINDYGCLENKCSEFLYTPIEMTEALAIRKFHFTNVIDNSTLRGLKRRISTNYKYLI